MAAMKSCNLWLQETNSPAEILSTPGGRGGECRPLLGENSDYC